MGLKLKTLRGLLVIALCASVFFTASPSLAADITPPIAYGGVEVYYKNAAFELTGEATDVETGYLDLEWSQLSAPTGGVITFTNPLCLKQNFNAYCKTEISANKDGVYVFRFKATNDAKLTAYDDVALVWDTTAPVLTEKVPVPAITSLSRPVYTFTSSLVNATTSVYNQYGDVVYGGACRSGKLSAKGGDNLVTFYLMDDGQYDDCTITVTDRAGNVSNTLKISPFEVDTSIPATPPPTQTPVCTSYSYSDWSPCDGGEQVRTTTASSPEGCIMSGSQPVTKQSCTEDTSESTVCTSYSYSDWSPCDGGEQVRSTTASSPDGCIMSGVLPVTEQSCSEETSDRPVCTSYTYGDWSPCDKGQQIRVYLDPLPANCIMSGVLPVTKQSCTVESDTGGQSEIEVFSDVPTYSPYHDALTYLKENEIISGYSDGSFKPDNTINRAEFTKIIAGAVSTEDELSACMSHYVSPGSLSSDVFTDVTFSAIKETTPVWFFNYICVAKLKGFVGGYADGGFRPAQNINFVEAAKIITTALGYQTSPTTPWYKAYVDVLADKNAIPTSITSFSQNITRGEMSEMMWRLQSGVTDLPSAHYDDFE